jgi:glycosyltransferase involved in cell wall biosynthesis
VLVTSFPLEWEYAYNENVKRINLFDNKIDGFLKRNMSLTKALRKTIKSEKPEVVISFMAEPNFRMLLATVGVKCRKIISIRNDPNREYPNFVFKLLAKTLYNLADGVVFQTEDAKKWFPKSIQKKSRIIMNQVDDVFFNTPLEEERHDIVTIGRLTAQKNHKMLIKAFSMIASEIDENLIIYGDGELRGELEMLVKELHLENRVSLPGVTKNVPEVLSKAKLFVLSSDYEGMPNALMEAMAMGLPCISTDCPCGGSRDVLSGLEKKCLVEVENSKKMADAIKKTLNEIKQTNDGFSMTVKSKAKSFSKEIVLASWISYIGDLS